MLAATKAGVAERQAFRSRDDYKCRSPFVPPAGARLRKIVSRAANISDEPRNESSFLHLIPPFYLLAPLSAPRAILSPW